MILLKHRRMVFKTEEGLFYYRFIGDKKWTSVITTLSTAPWALTSMTRSEFILAFREANQIRMGS